MDFSEADPGKITEQHLKTVSQAPTILAGSYDVGRRRVAVCWWAVKVKWILLWGSVTSAGARVLLAHGRPS